MVTTSVIITTHNRPDALRRALASVRDQTQKAEEVVVVDDGSDPPIDSDELTRRYSSLDITCVRNEKSQGPGGARNRGVKESSGDIVMFLDDDDTWEPSKIKDQIRVFERRRKVGLVYSGRLMVSHKNRSRTLYHIEGECEGDIYPDILYSNCIGVTSSVSLRRSIFEKVGGFDEKQPAREDYEMWIRCAKVTNVAPDGGYGLRYTVTSASGVQMSRSPVPRHVRAVRRIMSKHWADIQDLGSTGVRKVRAEHWYYVAKMARRHSLRKAMKWIFRSLKAFPMLKTPLLVLSPGTRRRLRTLLFRMDSG